MFVPQLCIKRNSRLKLKNRTKRKLEYEGLLWDKAAIVLSGRNTYFVNVLFAPSDRAPRCSPLLPNFKRSLPHKTNSAVWLGPRAWLTKTGAQHCDATFKVTSLA